MTKEQQHIEQYKTTVHQVNKSKHKSGKTIAKYIAALAALVLTYFCQTTDNATFIRLEISNNYMIMPLTLTLFT